MHSVFCQHVATTLERGCFATPPEAAGFDTTGHGLPKLRSCEPFDGFLAVFVAPPNEFNWLERINSLAPPWCPKWDSMGEIGPWRMIGKFVERP